VRAVRRVRSPVQRVIAAIVASVTLLAGCVVLRAPRVDERPRWRLAAPAPAFDHGCVLGRAWIRKSGKDGVGMTVELRSRPEVGTGDCAVAIARAALVFPDGKRVDAGIRDVPLLRGRSLVYTWIAFPFDNNRAWNDGRDEAAFELDLVVAGAAAPTWRMKARHAF
jgi:hypothetical protein